MVTIERVLRPFWMHQIVEYLLGVALIMRRACRARAAVPALMGLLILLNAAVVDGPARGVPLVPRRLHRYLDLGRDRPAPAAGRAAVARTSTRPAG